ncbi:type I methionyl aminopeptidase [Candidatus Daviesbacteria bacterium RIFCSPLOWO2_02_FULL_36_8]|uniref:Methionine aminopeptidase n=1 Tax=Candidatus Daviesbacteria bacterium RIFCSPLOWO2_02_FULL_36_8 TaxID=1797793 RepID=A0A1F5MFL3_9BACT|nr:MAG: type I methionyl aminopeptidase [Candidatus Daviesbacteria bacterium RIFCSPLOWO2_02_FULL_36_8]
MKKRNSYELELLRKSGKIAGQALKKSMDAIKVGVSELIVDKIAEEVIYSLGGDLSYKTVPGYKYATCVTVNEQVVHGIPTDRKFTAGDLASVDLAVMYKGWHTDCAWTILVDQGSSIKDQEKKKFLEIGQEALWDGIAQAVAGNRVGDISNAIQSKVEGNGYNVVRSLVGHGVGKSLHEEPEIPGYGEKGTGMILKSGMSLAIEVIYAMGNYDVVIEDDNWTYATEDKSLSGLFEMTVIVGEQKAEVLTHF